MGKADISERDFLKDNYIFADAVNYRLFDGKQVVDPEKLTDLDTSQVGLIYGKEGMPEPIARYRDIAKLMTIKEDEQATYVVITIEAQTEVHFGMPAKCMLYDALEYKNQIDKITAIHNAENKGKKRSNKDFLSGLHKEDRLKPVITLVIFFSPEEWDGPLSIYDMLETDDPNILAYVENYKIHLISPNDMGQDDFGLLKTDLREVLEYIKYSNDKEKLRDYVENNERMHDLNYKAAYTIFATTNTKWDLLVKTEKGSVNMCKAIDDLVNDGIEKSEARYSSLISILLGNNRIDDLKRAAVDDGYRSDLMRKYNLV